MHRNLLYIIAGLFFACTQTSESEQPMSTRPEYVLVIHGGAGTITRAEMTAEMEAAYLVALNAALDVGEQILRDGGTSLDAVEKTIMSLEDSPLFNAGKGSVYTHEGTNEMDASIMDGRNRMAGAVTCVQGIRNPIVAARAVMEKSEHVMLSGTGAETFAAEHGIAMAPSEYFFTQRRWDALQHALERDAPVDTLTEQEKHGTVGALALDKHGNLAAATSTGGMTNKRFGRIGDTPVIGAGTFADNATCAVSGTGHGEYFIRYAVGHAVSAAMEYGQMSLEEAAHHVVHEKLKPNGGSGGLIGLDAEGNVAMPFNTEGMYRGYTRPGERVVRIYED